jgi:pSer/pThr/pTyr-binding forkhead associated (FHA) protein
MIAAELSVVGGKHSGQVIPLNRRRFLIGREHDCQLRPNSERVSRHHCVFSLDDFSVRLKDLGSTNGTFVNGNRISKEIVLKSGDHVVIGNLEFQLSVLPGKVVDPSNSGEIDLRGRPDDTQVSLLKWRRNGLDQGFIPLLNGQFSQSGLRLEVGTNRLEVVATDPSGNIGTAKVEVVWVPQRTLRLADATDVQEGQRIKFPLTLSSPGDVSGLTFRLNYEANYLADPKVELSAAAGQSVNSINISTPGEISGSLALGGSTLPAGNTPLATVSFRARSVPLALTTTAIVLAKAAPPESTKVPASTVVVPV